MIPASGTSKDCYAAMTAPLDGMPPPRVGLTGSSRSTRSPSAIPVSARLRKRCAARACTEQASPHGELVQVQQRATATPAPRQSVFETGRRQRQRSVAGKSARALRRFASSSSRGRTQKATTHEAHGSTNAPAPRRPVDGPGVVAKAGEGHLRRLDLGAHAAPHRPLALVEDPGGGLVKREAKLDVAATQLGEVACG